MTKLPSTLLIFLIASSAAHARMDLEQVQVSNGSKSSNCASQTYQGFVDEFKKPSTANLTEADSRRIQDDYSGLMLTAVDCNAVANAIEGRKTSYFQLEKIKSEPFYADQINKLLHSKSEYSRTLGYMTLASAGDTSFNDLLLQALKTESSKSAKIFAGLALLYLQDQHTGDLFDFLVENEEFGDAHMLPFYLKLNKDKIRRTAFEKMDSKNSKAQILAIQSLSVTGKTPETEQVVQKAVKTWEPSIRGYAIYTAKELGVGNLKEVLTPLPKEKSLRSISLEALANSPTQADQDYLASLIPENSEIADDVLNAYLNSNKEESVRRWLSLIRDKKINSKYDFSPFDKPWLTSDKLLDSVFDTIRHTKNPQVIHGLARTLSERKDEASVQLLLDLLSNSDYTVRYWAASSLKGNSSPQLVQKLPGLIKDPNLRTEALTKLAIENNVDGLQNIYEELRANGGHDWRWSALEYLSAFPRAKDRDLFLAVLQSKESALAKELAVAGLGNLKDTSAVDAIVQTLHAEPLNDTNPITYLVALGKIKGPKAKEIVESYKDSNNETVRNLVSQLLEDW